MNTTSPQPLLAPRPRNIEETGLSFDLIAALVCKHLYVNGIADLLQLSETMALAGNILEVVISELRKQSVINILAPAPFSSGPRYTLTDKGVAEAQAALRKSGYVGPAPVPLEQYKTVVLAQSTQNHKITRAEVKQAFADTIIDPYLLDQLGPAMHSGRAIMIYGLAGSGKTYICRRLARVLGEPVLIPHAISVGESIIQVYDPALHRRPKENPTEININLQQGTDPRYIKCQRPVAVSGGELTQDMLEIHHDTNTRLSQAPLQLKANNGMYLIDDLGRQRIHPTDLFNRWIVPLEEKHDYLSLENSKRIQVPFDVILIFSANINPLELADEAFLRRLGYKIRFAPVTQQQYIDIWHQYLKELQLSSDDSLFDSIFERYKRANRPLLPCQPRDLLGLIKDQCEYEGETCVVTQQRFNIAWDTYFINLENARMVL